MERELKFRGLRNNGKWIYGGFCRRWNDKPCIVVYNPKEQQDDPNSYEDDWDIYVDVYEDTIGQFTGMLDKNGKEIYEGDIIRIDSHAWLDWKELDSVNAEVIFEEYMFDARWRNPDAGQPIPFHPDDDPDYESEYICEMLANLPNTIEVIGNIYNNPELIK